MNTLILRTATQLLVALMLLFSFFLLLRGHDEPGGGFVGGLMAVGAFALYAVAYGVGPARTAMRIDPLTLLGLGLVIATLSGLLAAATGQAFLTGLWLELTLLGGYELKLGSTLMFDIGVYFVVVGATLAVIMSLEEAEA